MTQEQEDRDLFDGPINPEEGATDLDPFGGDFSLGDLTDNDLSLDNADLSTFGNIDTDIPLPHVRVQTKEFQNYLRVAKMFSASSGRDMVSKSVHLSVEDGQLLCRTTDYDSYLTYKMEILNEENVLNEEVVIPIDILQKLTKASPANVAIIRDGNDWKMRIAGGDILLETLSIAKEKFLLQDEFEKKADVDAEQLLQTLRALTPIIQAAVTPTERRILCRRGKATASYMWAVITSPGDYPDTELKVKDTQILKPLLTGQEGNVTVLQSKGEILRSQLRTPVFTYTSLTSTVESSEQLLNQLEEASNQPGTHVDLLQLFKMVELSADLPYSTGKIGLNYDDEGISLAIKTKKGSDSKFSIPGSPDGRTQPIAKELVMQAKLLRVLLRAFNGSTSIRVSISEKGLALETDTLQAACFTES